MSNNSPRARTVKRRSTLIRALIAAVLAAVLDVFLIPAGTSFDVLLAAGMAFGVVATSRPSSSR